VQHAVLAVATAGASRFRVIEVIKGKRPSGSTIEGGDPSRGSTSDSAATKSGKPLLLVRDNPWPVWTIVGAIGAGRSGWLRKLAAGMPAAEMSAEEWRDRKRWTHEIEAVVLALSVLGNANGPIPRDRVIQSYWVFMKKHKEIAGYVAMDLAAWQYWDAVSEYVALMKSDVRQQYPSRLAIIQHLRQSPQAQAIDDLLTER